MARVPPPPSLHKHIPTVAAGVLDVDAHVPHDFDWNALVDDDDHTFVDHHQHTALPPAPRMDGVVADPSGPAALESPPPQPKPDPRQPPHQHPQNIKPADHTRHPPDPHTSKKTRRGKPKKNNPSKNQNQPNSNTRYCNICDTYATSDANMSDHLRGKKHQRNETQFNLRNRNMSLSNHGRAISAVAETPRQPETPRQAETPSQPDRFDKPSHPPHPDNSPPPPAVAQHVAAHRVPDSETRHAHTSSLDTPAIDRDAPQSNRDSSVASRDPRVRAASKHPTETPSSSASAMRPHLASETNSRVDRTSPHSNAQRPTRVHAAMDNTAGPQPASATPLEADKPTRKQQHANQPGADAIRPDKLVSSDASASPQPYVASADGSSRRRLNGHPEDPRSRYVEHDRLSARPSGSPRPRPPGVAEPRVDRGETDARRGITQALSRQPSERESQLIPSEWMQEPMGTGEWRDLRKHTFENGDDIDRLAYKMMQEMLLSPVLGVQMTSLKPFSDAMTKSMNKHYYFRPGEVYAKPEDYPKELLVRDDNFSKADPRWQKTRTREQLATSLVKDNIIFMLNANEDSEVRTRVHPSCFPRRGSFGSTYPPKPKKEGQDSSRYDDVVTDDHLYVELYDYLFEKRRHDTRE